MYEYGYSQHYITQCEHGGPVFIKTLFSMSDTATEARRQLPGDPLLTTSCMSYKRSTVQSFQC